MPRVLTYQTAACVMHHVFCNRDGVYVVCQTVPVAGCDPLSVCIQVVVINITPRPCIPNIFGGGPVNQHMKMPAPALANTNAKYVLDIPATAFCYTAQALYIVLSFRAAESPVLRLLCEGGIMFSIERRRYKESCGAVREIRRNDRSQCNSGITIIYKLLRLCSVESFFISCFRAVSPGDIRESRYQMITPGL